MLLPLQIVVVPDTVITGIGLTVMVTVVVPVHDPDVPLTVYVVVVVGVAVGLATLVALNPVAGAQE